MEPSAGFAAAFSGRAAARPSAPEQRAAFGLLRRALERRGIRLDRVVVASVFTTGSVSAFLEQARDALDRRPPAPALMTAPESGGRAWFPRGTAVAPRPPAPGRRGGARRRQARRRRADGPPDGFRDDALPLEALPRDVVGGVGIGWYWSPWYLTPERRIVEPPTLGPQRARAVDRPSRALRVVTPAGRPPPEGWPLAVFGHGYGGEMLSSALLMAGGLARHGIATVAISVVGHGGGPEGRLLVTSRDGRSQVVRVPGRGVDLDGDGRIESDGGSVARSPAAPWRRSGSGTACGSRWSTSWRSCGPSAAGSTSTATAIPDTGQGALSYAGHSLGGIYGTLFLAVEPRVRVGALVVPGGPDPEVARLSPVFRPRVKEALGPPEPAAPEPRRATSGRISRFAATARSWRPRPARSRSRSTSPGSSGSAAAAIPWRTRATSGGRRFPGSTPPARWSSTPWGTASCRTRRRRRSSARGSWATARWCSSAPTAWPARAAPSGPIRTGSCSPSARPGLIGRVAMLAQEQVARFLRDEGETLWIPERLSSAGPDEPLPREPGLPSR